MRGHSFHPPATPPTRSQSCRVSISLTACPGHMRSVAGWPCRCSASGRVPRRAWEVPCRLPCHEPGAGGDIQVSPPVSGCPAGITSSHLEGRYHTQGVQTGAPPGWHMAEPHSSPWCGLLVHLVFPQHLRRRDENLLSDSLGHRSLLRAVTHLALQMPGLSRWRGGWVMGGAGGRLSLCCCCCRRHSV